MDSEDKMWAVFQICVTVIILVVAVTAASCVQQTNDKILKADTCEKVAALSNSTKQIPTLCAAKAVRHD
jgi:hypothetical protein